MFVSASKIVENNSYDTEQSFQRLHARPQGEVAEDGEICQWAGMKEFSTDTTRYCFAGLHAHGCSSFRLKPFNSCPSYRP